MRNGFRVVDGDGHMQEPMDMWENYMPEAFKDRAPKVIGHASKILLSYGPCEVFPEGQEVGSRDRTFFDMKERYGKALESWFSVPTRLGHMDDEGVDIAVGFPTNCQMLGSPTLVKDPALHVALVEAYNNWTSDYCKDSGGRVKTIGHASSMDVEAGVQEIHRMARAAEVVGIFHPGMDEEAGKGWGDPAVEPLWAALAETDLPVCWHGSASHTIATNVMGNRKGNLMRRDKYGPLGHAIGHPFGAMLAVGGFIMSGVLEKYPTLKAGFYESNAGWLPFWLTRLDDHAFGRQGVFHSDHTSSTMSLKPSEYFQRQCFIACDGDEGTLNLVAEYMDGENIVFNTDYPHPDAPFPGAVDKFLAQPLKDDHRRKILWDNSVRLYGDKLLAGTGL